MLRRRPWVFLAVSLCLTALCARPVSGQVFSTPGSNNSSKFGIATSIDAISSSQISWVFWGWYLAYALFQLPSGWIADRLGSKTALLLFATLWSCFSHGTLLAVRLQTPLQHAGITGWRPLQRRSRE